MNIYIPTMGRPESQITFDFLGKFLQRRTYIVCPKDEVKFHKKFNRRTITFNDVGISKKRQFIIDFHLTFKDENKLIMIDDDAVFFVRKSNKSWHLRKLLPGEMKWIINRLYLTLDKYVHAGVSPRQMNNVHFPNKFKIGQKQNLIHAIRPNTLKKLDIRYDTMDLMEDYYVTLSLFTLGFPNAILTDVAWDQKGSSNDRGGCSLYRNEEMQRASAERLKSFFPDFVKVITKESKTGWKNMKRRTDVRISWKKALDFGIKARSS